MGNKPGTQMLKKLIRDGFSLQHVYLFRFIDSGQFGTVFGYVIDDARCA